MCILTTEYTAIISNIENVVHILFVFLRALPQHMIPEILRSPLLDIVLSIKLLMLGDINSYLSRCIEPPTDVAIQEAIYLLKVKNALDMEENITPLGSIVARYREYF